LIPFLDRLEGNIGYWTGDWKIDPQIVDDDAVESLRSELE
jgi:hypothetical protein